MADRLANVTIRGRVAFALAIAERNLSLINDNVVGYAFAQNILSLAWDWVGGVPVAPSVFADALQNEQDEGILIFEQQTSGVEKLVWLLIASAVAYTGWHVYSQVGQVMPDTINESGEPALCWVIDYALRISPLNQKFVDALSTYCVDHWKSDGHDALGLSVHRTQLIVDPGP